ncbi:beta-galactofuranosyl transferase [Trypanosoma conorhini]|uniref:Beta-galactofuranosyl transferase n=1 Tax=Trypanosoma conorhini TaxID=83891 RepID=A0A3R7MGD0_9TRYP|nr:beta-galactofuranosyl transferase [Trypanosoma conorhini]RNF02036.1 beta-galactofuranosyl transferase [Trypanosoma conorhini]
MVFLFCVLFLDSIFDYDAPEELGVDPLAPECMECVGERLLVDAKTGRVGDNSGENVIPLMVVPLMLDLVEFKKVICNISVPIRRLVLVQNGEEAKLWLHLQKVENLYGRTGRLIVRHFPENTAYSSAVNVGLRFLLSLPCEEAPFVVVTNSDVTFSPELLPKLLRDAYAQTRHDAARMDALAAEVANEPNEYSRASGRNMKLLRSTPEDGRLSTSALLPDRIRYAPLDARATAFSQHYACFCAQYDGWCFTSVILTRLAFSTVGYFDENIYPAYFEDVDYLLRLRLRGFKERKVRYGTFVHQLALNARLSKKLQVKEAIWYRRVRQFSSNYVCAYAKWGRMAEFDSGYKEPFNGTVPVDVWVRMRAAYSASGTTGMMSGKEFQLLATI